VRHINNCSLYKRTINSIKGHSKPVEVDEMKINASVCIQISSKEFQTRTFSIEIPDEVIEDYARHNLDLMTQEEAVEFVADNPPDDMDEDE
jgi:hypothetical protein